MAFSTRRGRPRQPKPETDFGTPELRLKQAFGATAEPIDLCLERKLIDGPQHWCGLHLRWLYTLRYGAPSLTAHYADPGNPRGPAESDDWRAMREREYHEAARLLKARRRYECVMRLAVYNEHPGFLNHGLRERAWGSPALAERLSREQQAVHDGLELLVLHWRRSARDRKSVGSPHGPEQIAKIDATF